MPKHPLLEKLREFEVGKKYATEALMAFNKKDVDFTIEINKVELNTCGICVDDGSDNWPIACFQKQFSDKEWECTLAAKK